MPLMPRAQALHRLRQLTRRAGRPLPGQQLPRPLVNALLHHCGSLVAARRAARVAPLRPPRRWTQALVVAELRRLYRRGLLITYRALADAGHHGLKSAIHRCAGGIRRARLLARVPGPVWRRGERESWSEERVIDEILELHDAGKPLAVTKAPSQLVHSGTRLFGSWREAITAAGLDYATIRLRPSYTDEELFDRLRQLAARRPEMTLAQVIETRLGRTVVKRFSSLEDAARRAGLRRWPVRVKHPTFSRAATIAALRARRRAGKAVYSLALRREDGRLLHAAVRHFGTVEAAITAAGIPTDSPRTPWTTNNIIRHLAARRARGEPLHAAVVQKELPGLYHAAQRLYGSYYAIASRYGAKPRSRPPWSAEETLKELRRVARRHRGVLRINDVGGGVLAGCYRHFGSFKAARKAAGLAPLPLRWTRERVIRDLRAAERAGKPGRPAPLLPTLREAARRHFGGIADARRAAGLKPLPA